MWPVAEVYGIMWTNNEKAISHGLVFRPLGETIQDTLEWSKDRAELKAGLSLARETELLDLWHTQGKIPGIVKKS